MEKKPKTFEENFQELEILVKDLENGNVSLDSSIEKYTKAMALAKECGDKLSEATKQVNSILLESGNLEEFKLNE